MKIVLKPGHEIVHAGIDGTENAWELWQGDSFLHVVLLTAPTSTELLAAAAREQLIVLDFNA